MTCTHGMPASECWTCQPTPASAKQVGGNHYAKLAIQPERFIYENGIGFHEGNAIKYLVRWREKGGVQDLDKAIHFIELLKANVEREASK